MSVIKEQSSVCVVHQRSNAELTQEALAAKADLSSRHIQDIEAAKKMAKVDTVFQLAYALDVDYKTLLQPAWDQWLAEKSSK